MTAILPAVFGGAGSLVTKLFAKPGAQQSPAPGPTRNAAAEAAMKSDQVAKRRGVAANMLLGASGAESGAGKTALGT